MKTTGSKFFSFMENLSLSVSTSMERLQLVSLHRCFILVQVCEWVLGTIVMRIIVGIDRLSLQTGNRVKLLDGGSTQTSECPEHGTLDLSDLSILNGIDKSVLGLRCMVLQLLGSVLLAERSNLIEVHLKIMRHLFGKFILWCATSGELQEHCLRRLCLGICSAVLGCKVWVVTLKQLAKERILCASLTLRNLGMCLASLRNFIYHNLGFQYTLSQCVNIHCWTGYGKRC